MTPSFSSSKEKLKSGTFRKSCTSTATKLGTTEHFLEIRLQRLLEHFGTAPLGTYLHHLPSQEILTLFHLLIIHQEVSNPWLQDVEFGRRHILVHTHKTIWEETRHQAISSAPSPWEGFCAPRTATNPRRLLKSTQVHPLLCKDPSQGHCAEEATLLGAHRSCCILLGQWRGTLAALECVRGSASLPDRTGHLFLAPSILFIITQ